MAPEQLFCGSGLLSAGLPGSCWWEGRSPLWAVATPTSQASSCSWALAVLCNHLVTPTTFERPMRSFQAKVGWTRQLWPLGAPGNRHQGQGGAGWGGAGGADRALVQDGGREQVVHWGPRPPLGTEVSGLWREVLGGAVGTGVARQAPLPLQIQAEQQQVAEAQEELRRVGWTPSPGGTAGPEGECPEGPLPGLRPAKPSPLSGDALWEPAVGTHTVPISLQKRVQHPGHHPGGE